MAKKIEAGHELDERQLLTGIKIIARTLGDGISDEKSVLDSRLPDGSRVTAVLPPCSVDGITLDIRKFDSRHFTMADLIARGSVTTEAAQLLEARIAARRNILISGARELARRRCSAFWPGSFLMTNASS